jgi:hypothetical protein
LPHSRQSWQTIQPHDRVLMPSRIDVKAIVRPSGDAAGRRSLPENVIVLARRGRWRCGRMRRHDARKDEAADDDPCAEQSRRWKNAESRARWCDQLADRFDASGRWRRQRLELKGEAAVPGKAPRRSLSIRRVPGGPR